MTRNASIKRTLAVILIFAVITPIVMLFISRFTLSLPSAESQCLETTMFIVDKWDKNVQQGDLVAFKFEKDDPYFDKGLSFIKLVAAKAGDTVDVTPQKLLVNNTEFNIAGMTHVINFLELNPNEYITQSTLNENELYVVGETIYSYDSRFWGAIDQSNIIGKAYAIF
ncbi:signal peptidase I [uncultured Pseudoalteromonas sp.]|uniref:signal peptidase I n=1 Tax=uncultured Pseudoalteromonas sp. TaxID=114053 RepID=UPI002594CF10|nr:signal peptidase I [uncultured Pseudoalteromonas sp.]